MDPLTHGLTGALLGKAFFAERQPDQAAARLATFSATLGAVFPDIDILAGPLTRNNLAVIEYHRNFTHSFVCLPVFALALAFVTRAWARRRARPAPSLAALVGIYAAGLASHILLDLITSFGTMIWSPLSRARAAWDLVFIIDLTMTAIVLLPQAAAWVYREREQSRRRAIRLWVIFTACAALIDLLARLVGFPFAPWAVVLASLLFATLFFLPAWHGWGFALRRSSWCRAGLVALVAYLGLCAAAHRAVVTRLEQFAQARGLRVIAFGAMPVPPSAARWDGLIRTPDGVYEARFDLLNSPADDPSTEFRFFADAAPSPAIEAALELPRVQKYLWFARFPVVRFAQQQGQSVVEITDLRFATRRNGRRPLPFAFRVTLDAQGHVLEQGWAAPEP